MNFNYNPWWNDNIYKATWSNLNESDNSFYNMARCPILELSVNILVNRFFSEQQAV